MQPGYVTAEDDVTGSESDENSLTDDAADDADELHPTRTRPRKRSPSPPNRPPRLPRPRPRPPPRPPARRRGLVEQDDAATTETDGAPPVGEDETSEQADGGPTEEPAVATDVDPFDEPLTESIGDARRGRLRPRWVAGSVDDTDEDPQP